MRLPLLLIGGLWLGGCTTLPDVPLPPQGFDGAAEYPDFVPMRRVALDQQAAEAENLETEERLQARVARLRARAAALRIAPTD